MLFRSEERISEHLACADCGISLGKLEPRNFSFNSPYGACPVCSGIGSLQVMDPAKVVEDENATLRHGAVPAWRRGAHRLIIYYNHMLKCIAAHYGIPKLMDTKWRDLPEHVRHVLLYGSGDEIIDFSFYMRGKRHEMKKLKSMTSSPEPYSSTCRTWSGSSRHGVSIIRGTP